MSAIALIYCIQLWVGDALIASGNHSTTAMAKLLFAVCLAMSLFTYMCQWEGVRDWLVHGYGGNVYESHIGKAVIGISHAGIGIVDTTRITIGRSVAGKAVEGMVSKAGGAMGHGGQAVAQKAQQARGAAVHGGRAVAHKMHAAGGAVMHGGQSAAQHGHSRIRRHCAWFTAKGTPPPTIEDYKQSIAWVQRALVVFVFSNYLLLSPAILDGRCGTSEWTSEWGGWVALSVFYVAMSAKVSPLIGAGIAHHDEYICNFMILALNSFTWEFSGCVVDTATQVIALRMVFICIIAVLFFVVLRLQNYKGHSLQETIFTLASRIVLLCIGIAVCTTFITGFLFPFSSWQRDQNGCAGRVQVQMEPQYKPLVLGTKTGMPSDNSSGARFNESLLVGLHNAYHQTSPLSGVVQSWGYSHPSLYDQLELGYRELEIDVHWKRNAVDWRSVHLANL
jgi:hypothetical protein